MGNIREKVRRQARELIPVTVFFLVAFELLALTQALMLQKYGIRALAFLEAALAALVVAKVVLIADHVPFVNRFPDKPLVYNVLWKTAIYFAASVAVRYVEHVVKFWWRSGSFTEANRLFAHHIIWPHVICVQLWLLVLLLLYCTSREMVRALGRERVVRLFFRDPMPTGTPSSSEAQAPARGGGT
jgi:hypothetical protein